MAKAIDLTGLTFGKLTCVSRAENRNGKPYWNTICSCGKPCGASTGNLRSGNIRSCGCLGKAIRESNRLGLVNATFNRLTLISESGAKSGRIYWLAQCSCGNTIEVSESNVKSGAVKSCGCLRKENASAANFKHGKSRGYLSTHPEDEKDNRYDVWETMRKRCTNPKFKDWKYYGGKGIKVCSTWDDFLVFISDVGVRPDMTYTLERKDSDGDYCASNCYWATPREQALNRAGHSLWKPVRINGVEYPSMMRAEAALGLSVYKLKKLNELQNETINQI